MSDFKRTPKTWKVLEQETSQGYLIYTGDLIMGYKSIGWIRSYKYAVRVVNCVNALHGFVDPELWVTEAGAMLDKIASFEHPELKLGESKLDFLLNLAAERDRVKNNVIMTLLKAELDETAKQMAQSLRIYEAQNQMIIKLQGEKLGLLDALKGLLQNTTDEFAAANGFGIERQIACAVIERVDSRVNAGGGQ